MPSPSNERQRGVEDAPGRDRYDDSARFCLDNRSLDLLGDHQVRTHEYAVEVQR